MKLRYFGIALFVLCWLVVFSVPALRVMLRVETVGSASLQPYPWTKTLVGDATSPQQLAELYPNDVAVLAAAAESRDNKTTALNYDRLMRRFPRVAWLVADRLRYTTGWLSDDRLAGALESAVRGGVPSGTTVAPERTSAPPNFTPTELNAAIAVARQGRQLEPDNCYFDWMLAMFLYSGYHDAEALKVLHEGSLKPRYDDHAYDDMQAKLTAAEKSRPLLFEQKVILSATTLFPQYARFRHLARLLSWEAWKSESAGDHARALQIRTDLARIAAPMMQGRNTLIAGLVGSAMQSIAWGGSPARKVSSNRLRLMPAGSAAVVRAQYFSTYATLHGRADLAAETLKLGQATARFQQLERKFISPASSGFYGIPAQLTNSISSLWLLSLATLSQLGLCSFSYIVLFLFLLRTRIEPVRGSDLRNSILCTTVMALLLMLSAFLLGIGQYGLLGAWLSGSTPNLTRIALAFVSLGFLSMAPLLWGAFFCSGVTAWRIWQQRNELDNESHPRYEGISTDYMPRDIKSLIFAFMAWAGLGTTLFCWVAAVVAAATGATHWTLPLLPLPSDLWPVMDEPAVPLAVIALGFTGCCYFGWLIKWRFLTVLPLRPLSHYALRWHRQTLSAWLVLGSLIYLALSLASLPERQQADAQLNRYLQQGEIGLMLAKP